MSLVLAGEGPLRRLLARRGGSLPTQLLEEANKVREVISKTRGRPCSAVAYLQPHRVKTMGVDVTRDELLTINIDMTYPGLPCQVLSLDALDMSGKHEVNIGGELHKERISATGQSLGLHESAQEDEVTGFLNLFRPMGSDSPHMKKIEEIKVALHTFEAGPEQCVPWGTLVHDEQTARLSWKGNEWPGQGGGCGESVRVHWYTVSKQ